MHHILTSVQEQERTNMESNIEAWCDGLMEISFEVVVPLTPPVN